MTLKMTKEKKASADGMREKQKKKKQKKKKTKKKKGPQIKNASSF